MCLDLWVNRGIDILNQLTNIPVWPCVALSHLRLECSLEVKEQVADMARRAFAQIHLVCQLCLFPDWEALQAVTHALITSQLDTGTLSFQGGCP